jgi:hypothetical protein
MPSLCQLLAVLSCTWNRDFLLMPSLCQLPAVLCPEELLLLVIN